MMILLLINVSFWGLSQMGVWPVAGPEGLNPTNLGQSIDAALLAKQTGIPQVAFQILDYTVYSIGGFLTLIGLAAVAGFFTNASIVKSAGIVSFAVIFLWFYFQSIHILSIIHLPTWLVAIFSGFHFLILMLGVIQMATGMSFENMW